MFSKRSGVIGDLAVVLITVGMVFFFGELVGGFTTFEQLLFLGGLTPLLLGGFALRRLLDHARMQEALGESEALYRELFEDANDMVYTHDLEGRFTSLNKAGERLIDQPREQAVNSTIKGVLSLACHDRLDELIAQHLDGQTSMMSELEFLGKGGRRVPVEVSSRLIYKDGKPAGIQGIARDINERKRFEQQILHLASHDPLTELFNRRRFEEELQLQLAECRRYGIKSSLLFLDLDHFKDVNDTMGHWAGDELLARVGKLLADRLRDTDIAARLGGDEFTVILPHTDIERGRIVAEQLIATLGNHRFQLADQTFVITASVGIALIPEHGATAEELLSHADVAMYQAKENGRNRVCVYNPLTDWRAQTESRLTWRNRIGDALECGRFALYAQPILNLHTNEVSQYELLLRLVDPSGLVVDAAEFIDSAERFGLMQAIDRWVVQRGIAFAGEVNRRGRDVKMEINISGKAFADNELLPIIRRELASTQVDPHKIIFEVTETAAIHNIHQAREFVDELRRIGCRFALDDFGVGFSSFYQLKSLDVDFLKIDGSFIEDLPNDIIDQHLVKAMVEVARALNKETIAEFVADEETTRLLRDFGVGYAQGYHIGRPCPPIELLDAGDLAA